MFIRFVALHSARCSAFKSRLAAAIALFLALLSRSVPPRLHAQVSSQPITHDFGRVDIGHSGTPYPITFRFTGNLQVGSVSVLTEGASGKDFQAAQENTCIAGIYSDGSTCSVMVGFSPTSPGARKGAVVIYDVAKPAKVLATTYLSGAGIGPVVGFRPGLIDTVAGSGTGANDGCKGDGGPAKDAALNAPTHVTIDGAGNFYIADSGHNLIREVTTDGAIHTIAGNGTAGYTGDEDAAIRAEVYSPAGVAIDGAGNLYIADVQNDRIRRVDSNGNIATVAGGGFCASGDLTQVGDGAPATSACIRRPADVAVDGAGNLYVADTGNNRIRKITPDGSISTVAGSGTAGFSGDGKLGSSAELYSPGGVAVDDAGNLYIADSGNNRVRKLTPDGKVFTVAGSGSAGSSGDGGAAISAGVYLPQAVAVDSAHNLYIAGGDCRVRKVRPDGFIETVAGGGSCSYSGDGQTTTNAQLNVPGGMTVDHAGNLYIADSANNRIRLITFTDAPLLIFPTTTVGSSSSAQDVVVEDLGNAQLAITHIGSGSSLAVQGADTTCATQGSQFLNPGTSCTLAIEFTPQTGGTILDRVAISDNDLNVSVATQEILVLGTGRLIEQSSPVIGLSSLSIAPGIPNTGGADGNPFTTAFPAAMADHGTGAPSGAPEFADFKPAENNASLDADRDSKIEGQAPFFTSANSVATAVGREVSFRIHAAGNPVPTVSESGALPLGVTFNSERGVLCGVPAPGTGGVYKILFTADNSVKIAQQNFKLSIQDFVLNALPAMRAARGGTAQTTVIVQPIAGFSSPVSFTAIGLPDGVTASFDRPFATLKNQKSASAMMDLRVSPSYSAGSFKFTVLATGGALSRSTTAFVAMAAANGEHSERAKALRRMSRASRK